MGVLPIAGAFRYVPPPAHGSFPGPAAVPALRNPHRLLPRRPTGGSVPLRPYDSTSPLGRILKRGRRARLERCNRIFLGTGRAPVSPDGPIVDVHANAASRTVPYIRQPEAMVVPRRLEPKRLYLCPPIVVSVAARARTPHGSAPFARPHPNEDRHGNDQERNHQPVQCRVDHWTKGKFFD